MVKASPKLNHHPQKGYRLQIGYYLTTEGKKTGKVWWFGRIDPGEAECQAGLIREVFRQTSHDGFWTQEATERGKTLIAQRRTAYEADIKTATCLLNRAGMIVSPGPSPSPTAVKALKKVAPDAPHLFHASLDAFVKNLEQRRDARPTCPATRDHHRS